MAKPQTSLVNKTLTNKIGIQPATLTWRDGCPVSTEFDDVYFAAPALQTAEADQKTNDIDGANLDGMAETRHVFLQGNHLPERWQQPLATMESASPQHFVIGETGFGTGLNMLMAWQLWDEVKSATDDMSNRAYQHLHLISVEKHPLTKADLSTALANWPTLTHYSQRLLDAYPILMPGRYQLNLADDVTLTLIFADVNDALPDLNAHVDAWFLDGFAPAKNTTMWTESVFQCMAQWSKPQASLATFTAAGFVKRGLAAAGFDMQKRAGFGRKRDMLTGQLNDRATKTTVLSTHTAKQHHQSAIVIGSGLAGAGVAAALARYGVPSLVIDSAEDMATAASGVPAAGFRPYFAADWSESSQLYCSGFAYTAQHPATAEHLHKTGTVKLANVQSEQDRQQRLQRKLALPNDVIEFIDAKRASQLLGINSDHNGYWLPNTGWLAPQKLCQSLLNHTLIDLQLNITINQIKSSVANRSDQPHWQVFDAQQRLVASADMLVIATGGNLNLLPDELRAETRPVRGQVERVYFEQPLNATLNHRGYCVPHGASSASGAPVVGCAEDSPEQLNMKHLHILGASFVSGVTDTTTSEAETQENVAKLLDAMPDISAVKIAEPWVGIRAKCTGHLPIVGAIPDQSGLYVSIAHGARGLCSALLSGEQIAAEALGLPKPFSSRVAKRLAPKRFYKDTTNR